MVVWQSTDSVDTSSLSLFILLLGVVWCGLQLSVSCLVSLPCSVDGLEGGGEFGDGASRFSDECIIGCNFILDWLDFPFNSFLFFGADSGKSLGNRLKSNLQSLLLSGVSNKLIFVITNLSCPCGNFFLMSSLLGVILNLLILVFSLGLLIVTLLLNNVSSLNTFSDVGDGFFLSIDSLQFSSLDLRSNFSDLSSWVSNLGGLFSFLWGLSLKFVLSTWNLRIQAIQLWLQILNVVRLGSHFSINFLLLRSQVSDLLFEGVDFNHDFIDRLSGHVDSFVEFFLSSGGDFLDSSRFFSQLRGSLLLLNNLSGNIRSGGWWCTKVTANTNTRNDSWRASGWSGGSSSRGNGGSGTIIGSCGRYFSFNQW